ncbi:MAG: AAA family ATPase [Methanotrichaceae archaeon]|nr:AAA family ATPase [Methanotrichaceae archaeon]
MIINQIDLKNWKNFREASVPLSLRSFIMGPTGIGKANLLDAMRFLADIARPGGGLACALSARGGLDKIKFAAAKKKDLVEIEVQLADSPLSGTYLRYAIGLGMDKQGEPIIAYERIRRSGELILNRPDKRDAEDPLRLANTVLEEKSSNEHIAEIAGFLGSIRYLDFDPMLFRYPHPFPPADIPGDPYGRKILERMKEVPDSERKKKVKIIEDMLKLAVPQLRKLVFVLDEAGSPHLEGTVDIGRPRAVHREDKLSNGTLKGFAILWSAMEEGSVLLLEKPEAYLNPEAIHRICIYLYISLIRGDKQFIISTDGAEFLKDDIGRVAAKDVTILVPGREKEGTMAFPATSFPEIVEEMEERGWTADDVIPSYSNILTPEHAGIEYEEDF